MSSLLSPFRPKQGKGNINGNSKEVSGMSQEEFEWRRSQSEKVHQRMPKALHKLSLESEKVRNHFSDDPEALERWDDYMAGIKYAFSRNFTYRLSSHTQDSVLYKQLMKRNTRPQTYVGMLSGGYERVKQATRNKVPSAVAVATVAAALATGLAFGPTLWKQKQTKGA